jgi:hypothetical protein
LSGWKFTNTIVGATSPLLVGSCLLPTLPENLNGWYRKNTLAKRLTRAIFRAKNGIVFVLVNGEWLFCEDGVVRPVVQGAVRVADGQWLEVPFLLDGGADRTVFSARYLHRLQHLASAADEQIALAGVGGGAGSLTIETTLGFTRDDRKLVTIKGAFGVFTESESCDLSVLGRDVTNNFGVIFDYQNWVVALLAAPHFYEIKRRN